jgi:hypothetical protein
MMLVFCNTLAKTDSLHLKFYHCDTVSLCNAFLAFDFIYCSKTEIRPFLGYMPNFSFGPKRGRTLTMPNHYGLSAAIEVLEYENSRLIPVRRIKICGFTIHSFTKHLQLERLISQPGSLSES